MSQPFSTTHRIQFHETDAAGIMHFCVFFLCMEEAEHEFLRNRGLSVLQTGAEGQLSWPRVSCRCDYRSPVRFEDELSIEVHLARLGSKSATYNFRFTCQDRLVAEGEMTSVCCRFSHDAPPQSIEIPAWIRQRLTAA